MCHYVSFYLGQLFATTLPITAYPQHRVLPFRGADMPQDVPLRVILHEQPNGYCLIGFAPFGSQIGLCVLPTAS